MKVSPASPLRVTSEEEEEDQNPNSLRSHLAEAPETLRAPSTPAYGCGRFIRSSISVLSGPCVSIHCLTVAVTPDRRRSRAARWGSLRTGWMGSKAMACLMAELSAPPLRRLSLFQVDTRILVDEEE